MEVSVRYVRIKKLVRPSLCFVGEKRVHCVAQDSSRFRVFDITFGQYVKSPRVKKNGGDYPIDDFVEKCAELSQAKPVTQFARDLMAKVSEKATQIHLESPDEGKSKRTRGKAILRLARDFNLPPKRIRKFLRATGLNAPYMDDQATRNMLQKYLDSQAVRFQT